MPDRETFSQWMRPVIDRAREGVRQGQSPFAAAIYATDGTPISLANNTVKLTGELSRHGEVNAIDQACRNLNQSRLSDFWLLSTAEPCPICAATAATAGVMGVVFGADAASVAEAGYQTLGVSCSSLFQQFSAEIELVSYILESECRALLLANRRTD